MDSRSDYDDEEELREEVGELPPKIEDMDVQEYEEESENELPTVVIDSSLDEKDPATGENAEAVAAERFK